MSGENNDFDKAKLIEKVLDDNTISKEVKERLLNELSASLKWGRAFSTVFSIITLTIFVVGLIFIFSKLD
jgi:hypothetical protein